MVGREKERGGRIERVKSRRGKRIREKTKGREENKQ